MSCWYWKYLPCRIFSVDGLEDRYIHIFCFCFFALVFSRSIIFHHYIITIASRWPVDSLSFLSVTIRGSFI